MNKLPKWMVNLFMVIVWLIVQTYTIITLPLYYIIQKPWKVLQRSRVIRAHQIDPSNPYSEWISDIQLPYHPLVDCKTIGEALEKILDIYDKDRKIIGYREIIEEQIQKDSEGNILNYDGKVLIKYKLSDYKWLTYGDVMTKSKNIGKGLLCNGFKRYDKILYFVETQMENLLFSAALARIGGVYVLLFPVLDNDSIVSAINETEVTYCYATYNVLSRLHKILPKTPKLNTIIYVEGPPGSEPIPLFLKEITLWTLSKIEFDGAATSLEYVFEPLTEDDIPFILYTSGTTDAPKGVYASGRQMRNAGIAILPRIYEYFNDPEKQIFVAYLPQTHIMEIALEIITFLAGVRIGFAKQLTLYEDAPGLADGVECDLKMLKPTIMVVVPLVLERLKRKIYQRLKNSTPVSTDLFNYLTSYKIYWTQKGYDTPIINFVLCNKVRDQFGGNLKSMLIGGALLSPELQALIKAALNITLGQGFGSLETMCSSLAMDINDLSYGRVGAPLWGIRIKLVDWEEGGYRATDKPNPRGEIVVGGSSIASGYYNNEELTKETFFQENGYNYVYTGDIGEVFPDGTFKIIDRKKDLIKLANGEFVSLGRVSVTKMPKAWGQLQ